jgi:hypothetical protein
LLYPLVKGGEAIMKGHVPMSVKEINRLPVIEKLIKGELKAKIAAGALKICPSVR